MREERGDARRRWLIRCSRSRGKRPDCSSSPDSGCISISSKKSPKSRNVNVSLSYSRRELYAFTRPETTADCLNSGQELLSSSIGRPSIGGPFALTTQHNTPFTEHDLLGKWSLIYFGFTNCPDICPEELDKMGEVVEMLDKETGRPLVLPVFISCDPARDTVEQVKHYVGGKYRAREVG
jgi:hypothetical protein